MIEVEYSCGKVVKLEDGIVYRCPNFTVTSGVIKESRPYSTFKETIAILNQIGEDGRCPSIAVCGTMEKHA